MQIHLVYLKLLLSLSFCLFVLCVCGAVQFYDIHKSESLHESRLDYLAILDFPIHSQRSARKECLKEENVPIVLK